jgi:DNA-binding CsgD family transcriptional regulator
MPKTDVPGAYRAWVVAAFLLGAIARDVLGDPDAAGHALQRALDLAGPDQVLFPFVIDPPPGHLQALTHGETRVLHYLPTNLSAREIAGELYLSVNTVKTHQRHLYQKLGARSRPHPGRRAGPRPRPAHTMTIWGAGALPPGRVQHGSASLPASVFCTSRLLEVLDV